MLRTMALALAVPLSLALFAATRKPGGRPVGVVGIENATQVTVRLQHRWGDGSGPTDGA